jgi:hypothetical protein
VSPNIIWRQQTTIWNSQYQTISSLSNQKHNQIKPDKLARFRLEIFKEKMNLMMMKNKDIMLEGMTKY